VTRTIDHRERKFFDYEARGVPDGPDDGTIAPWVVVSSLPFAPDIVQEALRHFEVLKLRVKNPYGFKATFNRTFPVDCNKVPFWVSPWHFGIDQGPIVLMVENFRSGLIWRLMRKCPYLIKGLQRAGFRGGWLDDAKPDLKIRPAK
jgi:hypothetical protein